MSTLFFLITPQGFYPGFQILEDSCNAQWCEKRADVCYSPLIENFRSIWAKSVDRRFHIDFYFLLGHLQKALNDKDQEQTNNGTKIKSWNIKIFKQSAKGILRNIYIWSRPLCCEI